MKGASMGDAPNPFGSFDSTKSAPIMRLLLPENHLKRITFFRYAAIWLGFAVITYVPPLLVGSAIARDLVGGNSTLRLPYLLDVNIMMMMLVCLPALLVCHLREARLLPEVMAQMTEEGISVWQPDRAQDFIGKWQAKYARVNAWSVVAALAVSLAVMGMNYAAVLQNTGRSWQSPHPVLWGMNLLGWWFVIVQISIFWFVLTIQFIRMIAVIALLADFARSSAAILVNPLHPDRVGGLKPVARVGIQNQLLIAIVGVNVGSLFVVLRMLGEGSSMWIGITAAVAYVIAAPFAFLGPLVPFRPHMLRSKAQYLRKIADHFKTDLDAVLDEETGDKSTGARLQRLEHLNKLHSRISRLPEWPLDTTTLRRFGATLLSPAASVLASWLFGKLVGG